jgi:hypothetical protein
LLQCHKLVTRWRLQPVKFALCDALHIHLIEHGLNAPVKSGSWEALLLRSYDKFSEAERRLIMKWQLRFAAFYSAAFLVLVVFVITNHEISRWVAGATQAEMGSSIVDPTVDPTRVARNANKPPIVETKKSF